MANILRLLHRLAGGAGAGSPATVAPSGVVAINFDVAGTKEIWASDGSAWHQLNPAGSVTYATSADVITGTSTTTSINPAVLAGAATATSAGVADANKYVRYDAAGKLDTSVFTYATSAEIITGTDTAKLFNAAVLAGAATVTSAGAGDAGKYVRLDAAGKIDASILNVDAMEYKGSASATAAAPATPGIGDTYVISTAGAWAGSWGLTGSGAVGDMVIYNGTSWDLIQASNPDLSGYLPLAGTAGVAGAAMASGALVKMNPAAAGNVVFDAALGAIDNAEIDCGTF